MACDLASRQSCRKKAEQAFDTEKGAVHLESSKKLHKDPFVPSKLFSLSLSLPYSSVSFDFRFHVGTVKRTHVCFRLIWCHSQAFFDVVRVVESRS